MCVYMCVCVCGRGGVRVCGCVNIKLTDIKTFFNLLHYVESLYAHIHACTDYDNHDLNKI